MLVFKHTLTHCTQSFAAIESVLLRKQLWCETADVWQSLAQCGFSTCGVCKTRSHNDCMCVCVRVCVFVCLCVLAHTHMYTSGHGKVLLPFTLIANTILLHKHRMAAKRTICLLRLHVGMLCSECYIPPWSSTMWVLNELAVSTATNALLSLRLLPTHQATVSVSK